MRISWKAGGPAAIIGVASACGPILLGNTGAGGMDADAPMETSAPSGTVAPGMDTPSDGGAGSSQDGDADVPGTGMDSGSDGHDLSPLRLPQWLSRA